MTTCKGSASGDAFELSATLATYLWRNRATVRDSLLRSRGGFGERVCVTRILSPATIARRSPTGNRSTGHREIVLEPRADGTSRGRVAQRKRPSDQHGWSEGLPNNPGRKCGPTLASRRYKVNAQGVPYFDTLSNYVLTYLIQTCYEFHSTPACPREAKSRCSFLLQSSAKDALVFHTPAFSCP
jgi:hypothetical protein